MLTISIPTYNRPTQLRDTVARLLPQLDDTCELRVYDNCSTPPMTDVLADLLTQYSPTKIKIIRNAANIGMLGNIIRCMEDCPSAWLVMCGDDDPPKADFVEKTKRAIAKYPESIFVSFGFVAQNRSGDFVTNGLSEFVRGDWVFGDPLSISADAFRMDALRPFMSTAYMYAYTLGPHIAIVLAALRANGGQCAFVADQLADCGNDVSLESWSRTWYPSLVLLLELIPDANDRKAFGEKLIPYMIYQSHLARTLMVNSLETRASNSFLFASRMKLRSLLFSSLAISMKQKIFSYLIKNPAIGLKVLNFLDRRKQSVGFDGSKENIFGRV